MLSCTRESQQPLRFGRTIFQNLLRSTSLRDREDSRSQEVIQKNGVILNISRKSPGRNGAKRIGRGLRDRTRREVIPGERAQVNVDYDIILKFI